MCIPDLTASWFLPLYSKSKHRTIIFWLIDWFCKGLIFLHKLPPNLGIWDGLWRFNFNCKLHSKHFCVVLEKRMRNESHKKKHRASKRAGRGWGRKEEHSFPSPSPPSFFGSSSIFVRHWSRKSHSTTFLGLSSFWSLPHGKARYSGDYNCYDLTHCFRLRVFVNNGLPRWSLGALVRSSCTCNIFLKSKLDILYIYIEKSYIVVTWLYSFVGSTLGFTKTCG